MKKNVQFGEKLVGPSEPIYVTFEAGPTHNGVESAKKLIEHAATAGADAIKFQVLDPNRLISDKTQLFEYKILTNKVTGDLKTIEEPIFDIMKRRSLSPAEWAGLKAHAEANNLAFFATVGFEDEVDLMMSFGCDSIKIASADIDNFPLIKYAASTGTCIQLDTGNSSENEIKAAIDLICSTGNRNIILHHCPSGYPADTKGINLNIIRTLVNEYAYPIAFSDHSPGHDMDLAAIALGASLIEKTITEDREYPSVEHVMSIEPAEMAKFVELVKLFPLCLGENRRVLSDEERERKLFMRRSIFTKQSLKKGERITATDLDMRRPGFGISGIEFENVVGRKLNKDVSSGVMLSWEHLE